jgi:hypothetical protein
MKLSKQKKERIEAYIDMMEFNCDIRSCYTGEDFDYTIKTLNGILLVNCYLPSDKPTLQLLEKRFHKNKINWSL